MHRSCVYCRFSYVGNWELVKSIVGAGWELEEAMFTFSSGKQVMRANGSALLRYAVVISVQKLTHVIKSNTAGFLRIQRQHENTKENTKKTTEINWD